MAEYRQARMVSGEIVNVPTDKAAAFRKKPGFVAFIDEDPEQTTGDAELVPVETSMGTIWMKPSTERRTRNEREADDLAEAFDASMGAAPDTQTGEAMNGQGGDMLSPEMMEILQQYAQEGRLGELFQPFQQEQSVLNQEMEIAQGLGQRRAPQRSSPTGALFSGLANAAGGVGGAMLQKKGLEGQAALGQRMQGDASGRVGAILRAAMQRKGMDPNTGLMTPAVDDATLANLFSGG